MGNKATNVNVKFNFDQLHIHKALGVQKSGNNNKNKKNVHSTWGHFLVPKQKPSCLVNGLQFCLSKFVVGFKL